jgi:hypothetical protein
VPDGSEYVAHNVVHKVTELAVEYAYLNITSYYGNAFKTF